MADEYVRKDVYAESIRRMEEMMAASEARHERLTAEIRSEFKAFQSAVKADIQEIRGEVKDIRGDVKALSQQVDGLGDTIVAYVSGFSSKGSFWQGVLGAIIGLSAIVVAGVQVYLAVKAG